MSDVDDIDGNRLDDFDDDHDEARDVNTIEDADAPPAPGAQAVLEYLARSVVEDPDSVQVHVDQGRRGATALNVTVGQGDMGRVIGKRGRVA
ncbi:MAG: KH domain-containing protein, partial [Acidimicrobiales bacterium]